MKNGKLEEVRERLLERSKEELADAVINSQILISRLQQKLEQEKGKAKDLRQTIFGRSSEQSMYLFPMDELQDSLAKALEDFHEGDKVTVKEHVRQKRESSVTSLPADTPVFEVDHSSDDPDEVEKDGVVYVKSGTRSVDRIEYVPSRRIIRRDIYSVYTSKDGHVRDDGRQDRLVRMGNRNVDGLAAGPGFIAWILVGKFDDHLPLYRQAEMLARDGLAVSRQRLSFWLMRYGGELEGLWRYMKKRLYQMNLICQDETRVEVLASRTKTGSIRNDSYMFIRVGSSYDAQERRPHVLVLMEYIQGRSTDVLMEDYRRFGYQGYVMSDGLQQYDNIPQERHATCWVHAQRSFKKILKKNRKHQGAADMVQRINGLFSIHRQCMEAFEAGLITQQEFIDERRWKSYPVILGVLKEASRARVRLPAGDEFAKGCAYILNRIDSLFTYTWLSAVATGSSSTVWTVRTMAPRSIRSCRAPRPTASTAGATLSSCSPEHHTSRMSPSSRSSCPGMWMRQGLQRWMSSGAWQRLTYTGGIPTSSQGCPADGPDGLQHLLQCGRITFDERLMEPDRDLTGACLRLRLSQAYEACRLPSALDLCLHSLLVHPVGECVPIQALLVCELGDADFLILCSLQIFSD